MTYDSEAEYNDAMIAQSEQEAEYHQQLEQGQTPNTKTMKTGAFKSTVIEVESIKPWGEGQKKTFYHNLVMENGDKINIGKKTELAAGAELSYEIVEVGQQEYCKAKTYNPDFNQNGGAPRPSNNQIATKQSSTSPNASFCLAYAKDVYVAHGGESPSNEIKDVSGYITGLADEFLTWLNENSK